MENKVGEYHFTIRPFEVDFRNKLTLPLLINYLLNVAGYHADARGFGMEKINKDNRSWVLSRIAIELYKYPINNDEIMIQTWVENVMKMFTLRNFAIIGKNNEIYGYAKTVWAMIDTETRKPVSLTDEKINSFICDTFCKSSIWITITSSMHILDEFAPLLVSFFASLWSSTLGDNIKNKKPLKLLT